MRRGVRRAQYENMTILGLARFLNFGLVFTKLVGRTLAKIQNCAKVD
jgi:hypothetical protein